MASNIHHIHVYFAAGYIQITSPPQCANQICKHHLISGHHRAGPCISYTSVTGGSSCGLANPLPGVDGPYLALAA